MTDDLGPRQRAAETKKRRTRERLISATIDLHGMDDEQSTFEIPTLEKIAEEAGVSLPTLYNHFENRFELYLAAVTQIFDPVVRPIESASALGAYKPHDLRSEVIAYVCRASAIAYGYRYLIAMYIQSYFDNRIYDQMSGLPSRPLSDGLHTVIMTFTRLFDSEGYSAAGSVGYHLDVLLLTSCERYAGRSVSGNSPQFIAGKVLDELLLAVDVTYTRKEFDTVTDMIRKFCPNDET